MAAGEDVLWDAADKGMRTVTRLRRMAVAACCLGFFGLVMWAESDVRWAVRAAVAYVLVEIAYAAWDGRRLVEARIVPGEAGGGARLRLRRAGGRITDHDPRQVTRVLVIHDNVDGSARLRLHVRGRRLFFGRPGSPPALTNWRRTCPQADVGDRNARWGMPGIPD
ncbi:hypothetical protein [Streptomyces sp. G1]|uniref:hypothetical protein n=1 Tax=Streptomyces sp. G1 TaxID=361572 RepID=UPI00202F6DA4|nr:hypothetical protein [Streptomyces sp. G1]MCM1973482.1 hypothetical protein [Streptomyces sp. G1]